MHATIRGVSTWALGACALTLSMLALAAPRTERSTVLLLGNVAGFQEAVYADDGSVQVHYEYNDRGRGPKLDAKYRLAPDQTIDSAEITGVAYFKAAVDERYRRDATQTSWKNGSEDEKRDARLPGQYLTLNGPPEEFVLLVRALLASPTKSLPLLPVGEAKLEQVSSLTLEGKNGAKANVVLYATSGLDLTPNFTWLDDKGRFFAFYSDWSTQVREGFEEVVPALRDAQRDVETKLVRSRAKTLTHKLDGALVIDNARVFDPKTLAVQDAQRVVIEDGKIVAVGAMDTIDVPNGAERMDAAGRFAMPGLWDMHVHLTGSNDGVLFIANGITTVRDLANDKEALSARIASYEAGEDIGPRVVRSGFVDGHSPYQGPTKVFADNADEARAAALQFVEDGFAQIKVYSSLKPELVPIFAEIAHKNGMRLSGHVPQGMNAVQFVEAGADEIQHANFLFLNFLADASVDTRTPQRFSVVAERAVDVPLDGEPMRKFIAVLLKHRTVIDPTLVTFEGMFLDRPGRMGPSYADTIHRLPPTWQRAIRASTGGLEVTPKTDLKHRESYRRMIDLVGLMYRSGVTVVAGTDAGPLFTLARELELYTHAGIPPAEVLRIATLGAATVMKQDDTVGRIAPGYAADLILIDGDPTLRITDLLKIRTVVRGDRWYDVAKLYGAVGIVP